MLADGAPTAGLDTGSLTEDEPAGLTVSTSVPVVESSWRTWRTKYRALLLAADVTAAVVAIVVSFAVRTEEHLGLVHLFSWRFHYDVLAAASLPVWIATLALRGAYRRPYPAEGFADFVAPVITGLQLMAAVAVASFIFEAQVSRDVVAVYFPILIAAALLSRLGARATLLSVRRQGRALNSLILAGDCEAVERFAYHLARRPAHGYRIVGVCVPLAVDTLDTRIGPLPVLGHPDAVVDAAHSAGADSVAVVGHGRFVDTTLQQVAWQFERTGVDLLVAPDVVDLAGPRIRVSPVTGVPLLHITEPRIVSVGRSTKVLLERLVAVPLLIALSPLFALIAVAIVVDSGRPVFYRQRRVGQATREFPMLKFRSMVPDAEHQLFTLLEANEHDGALFKIRNDPRVTRVGRLLRKYSLDELPQLWNVVKGDMTLIGPRPCLARETETFTSAAHRRFLVKPGVTGLWQVNGRSDLPWDEAVRLDLYYIENWSPAMDLQILLRTLRVVIAGRGGY